MFKHAYTGHRGAPKRDELLVTIKKILLTRDRLDAEEDSLKTESDQALESQVQRADYGKDYKAYTLDFTEAGTSADNIFKPLP